MKGSGCGEHMTGTTHRTDRWLTLTARLCVVWLIGAAMGCSAHATNRTSTMPAPLVIQAGELRRRRYGGHGARHFRPDRAGGVQPGRARPTGPDASRRPRVRLLSGAGQRPPIAPRLLARSRPVRQDVGDDARRARGLPDHLPPPTLFGLPDRPAPARPGGARHGAPHHSRHARRPARVRHRSTRRVARILPWRAVLARLVGAEPVLPADGPENRSVR